MLNAQSLFEPLFQPIGKPDITRPGSGGGGPVNGYTFLRGKTASGAYVTLIGTNSNGSHSILQGKRS